VYGALLSVLLRLVFILYAEERGLLPADGVFESNYSLTGLFEELREDAARYPDTMDQRFGAWARLLTLFRLIFDGASYGATKLPARHGDLFDPDKYPFLEGRPYGSRRVTSDPIAVPRVSDGVVYGLLEKLLILDGERLSYRALDVEQIGSVYEAMMGFELRVANGISAAVRPDHVVVNLKEILEKAPGERARMLKDEAKCEVTGAALEQLKAAKSIDDLLKALDRRLSPRVKGTIPAGSMYLQPTEERRRTGSHYTPRSLTEPIVRTTLHPIFEAMGERPRPEQILDLKVCDPAMGSGAFLVEACRLLGDRLVEAWQMHRCVPQIPPDEDLHLYARRMVAQTCLYGVDKNPFAVDLAKLSLWLATLAQEHPFTFLDHALREGDSLVGLSREQIACFHWTPEKQLPMIREQLERALAQAEALRDQIRQMAESDDTDEKARLLGDADEALANLRLIGNLAIAAFFAGENRSEREPARERNADKVQRYLAGNSDRHELTSDIARLADARPIRPFHWQIEFPEVFSRKDPGFDAFIGNPPFLGGTRIEPAVGGKCRDWIVEILAEGRRGLRGAADLCAYFFLRAFDLTRSTGKVGLVATNSIAQGDSRVVGLKAILEKSGMIYWAVRSMPWPGESATYVAVVCISRSRDKSLKPLLDDREVKWIDAALSPHSSQIEEPQVLYSSSEIAFEGAKIAGIGFVITEEEAKSLIRRNSRNAEVLFPYLIGDDVNQDPEQRPSRWVINFKDWPLDRKQGHTSGMPVASDYPDVLKIVIERVRPERLSLPPTTPWNRGLIERWWQFGLWRPALQNALQDKESAIVTSRVTAHHCFSLVRTNVVFSDRLVVIAKDDFATFAIVSSRIHECWAHRPGATTQGTTLNYLPTRAFATFPLPQPKSINVKHLEHAGRTYHEVRANLMRRNTEGLTNTYNRFHDPEQKDIPYILDLHRLHATMDSAVLDAYGWTDLKPTCDFILDYEEQDSEVGASRKRKKPWRYRWPDDFRDEVLARLLALNEERAEQERLAGLQDASKRAKRTVRKKEPAGASSETLFK
jgi:hypothetical protein